MGLNGQNCNSVAPIFGKNRANARLSFFQCINLYLYTGNDNYVYQFENGGFILSSDKTGNYVYQFENGRLYV